MGSPRPRRAGGFGSTDATMPSRSSGQRVRRLSTSAVGALAGELLGRVQPGRSAWPTHAIVTSSPARATPSRPSGIGSIAVGTGPRSRYSAMCSRKITGLSSSIAASSRPCASAGVRGHHDLEPGHVGEERVERVGVLRRGAQTGAGRHPDDERDPRLATRHVAQLGGLVDDLVERSTGRSSPTSGRRPGADRPSPRRPRRRRTRPPRSACRGPAAAPNSSSRPLVAPNVPPIAPSSGGPWPAPPAMSSPRTTTVGSTRIACAMRVADRFEERALLGLGRELRRRRHRAPPRSGRAAARHGRRRRRRRARRPSPSRLR